MEGKEKEKKATEVTGWASIIISPLNLAKLESAHRKQRQNQGKA